MNTRLIDSLFVFGITFAYLIGYMSWESLIVLLLVCLIVELWELKDAICAQE